MASSVLTDQHWHIRLHVYEFFVQNARPPTYDETADHFNITPDVARSAYHRLNDAHAFYLNPGTDDVLMANPLSAVPTPYRVHVGGQMLYANCAWDSLGIPAMLHQDAQITANYAHTGEPVTYRIENGQLHGADDLVHYALPFKQWYDSLIHT